MALDAGTLTSIVALVVSLVALVATTLQVLQQYYASAQGYSNCSPQVMGLWARTTRRKFQWFEFRFQVQFEAPVIFVAPPNNTFGPVPDAPIWYMDGTDSSYDSTRTMRPGLEEEVRKEKSQHEAIHTADNELASWITYMSALQTMERDSREWEAARKTAEGPHPAARRKYISTMAIAVQSKLRSWDSMPNVKKPYATTTISHLIEMAAMLGIYWKEFDRKNDHYRAEGNGFILSGANLNDLGIVFTFKKMGKARFQENRVIPLDEVKELCFGFVPTIFREGPGSMQSPLDTDAMKQGELDTLQFGSWHEMQETAVLIGCDNKTVSLLMDGKSSHLFHVTFELMGMLGKVLHIRGSCFRMLPNPTLFYLNKKSFSLRQLLVAFHDRIKVEPDTDERGTMLRVLERIETAMQGQPDDSSSPSLLDALHEAIIESDTYLTRAHVPPTFILDVLWRHLQAVLQEINKTDSEIEKLNSTRPVDKEEKFIAIYFDTIRKAVVGSTQRQLEVPGRRPSTAASHEPTPGVFRTHTTLDDRRNNVWCTLVLRMLCWLLLHDFSKNDNQIPKSELLGSRLPVYII